MICVLLRIEQLVEPLISYLGLLSLDRYHWVVAIDGCNSFHKYLRVIGSGR